jgi:hypothetical protein
MSFKVRVRGIYATALTKLLLDSGFDIVDPSLEVRRRLSLGDPIYDEPDAYIMHDGRDPSRILVEGDSEACKALMDVLRYKIPCIAIFESRFNPYSVYLAIVVAGTDEGILVDLGGVYGLLVGASRTYSIGERAVAQVQAPCWSGMPKLSDSVTLKGRFTRLSQGFGVEFDPRIRDECVKMDLIRLVEKLGLKGFKVPDIFRLECKAIKKVRDEYGLKNVWVMIPFVRRVEELSLAKKIMEEEGLVRGPDFKVWIMVEVPSTVLLIDKFIEEGIDGVSFGTNDLTMLILGIDRDDAAVQEIYDERNLAVLRALSHVIRICRRHGVTTSICGQAPSNYPEVVEFLVREGATSISVNPDKVIETRLLVASIEQKILLEELRNLRERTEAEKPFFKPEWAKELG